MRIAIVYDCLYPSSIGGAERWYRALADHLASHHEVTYITRRQWRKGQQPETGFGVVSVSRGGSLYSKGGRRKIVPPILFGLGVFRYLLIHGRRFDIVDCASFPFFSLLAVKISLTLNRSSAAIVCDWFECWTLEYWISYLGSMGGRIGYRVQRLCQRITDNAITFSKLVSKRLCEEGYTGKIERLPGLFSGPVDKVEAHKPADPPTVVFAGRHIPEKRVTVIPTAIALVRQEIPNLRCTIFGDGPDNVLLQTEVERNGLTEVIDCPGFVDRETIDKSMQEALCLILPSEREGYGIVVVESAGHGTPSVVAASESSAASELVVEGENGYIASSSEPSDLAEAIKRVYDDGKKLREATARWFLDNAEWLSISSSAKKAEGIFKLYSVANKNNE